MFDVHWQLEIYQFCLLCLNFKQSVIPIISQFYGFRISIYRYNISLSFSSGPRAYIYSINKQHIYRLGLRARNWYIKLCMYFMFYVLILCATTQWWNMEMSTAESLAIFNIRWIHQNWKSMMLNAAWRFNLMSSIIYLGNINSFNLFVSLLLNWMP